LDTAETVGQAGRKTVWKRHQRRALTVQRPAMSDEKPSEKADAPPA